MTGENQTSKVWFNHALGMSALLRLRGQSQVETDVGSELYRGINSQLVAKDLGYGSDLSQPDPGTHKRETPKIRYTTLVGQRLVGLRRKFRKAVDSTSKIPINKTALRAIQRDAIELGKSFDTYPELVLPTVRYSESNATAPSSLLNDVFNSFPILQDAIAWNHFWYLRLRVFRLQLDCWNLLETNISSEQQEMESELISKITECADQISNTVPFLVGEINEQGMYQSQSLPHLRGGFYGCMSGMAGLNSVISTSELDRTRPCMRAWAFAQLDQVGNRVGLKQMSEFARFYQARIRAKASVRNLVLETVD